MKNSILLLALFLSQLLYSQSEKEQAEKKEDSITEKAPAKAKETTDSFFDRLKVGQSMETTDERGEPAQAVVTFPEGGDESYLVNLGIAYRLNSPKKYISRIKVELHKNTLTDSEQDNLEVGYQGTWKFAQTGKTEWFFTFDPKYVYDGIAINNAVASNLLFSWLRTNTKLNFNTNNYRPLELEKNEKYKRSFKPSLFAGVQVQGNFKSENELMEGFIVRPLASASLSYSFLRNEDDFIKYTVSFTARTDAINSTNVEEGYTKLFQTGLEVFIPNKALKVSMGVSYNNGSDPIKGLADQEYWMVSFNVHK